MTTDRNTVHVTPAERTALVNEIHETTDHRIVHRLNSDCRLTVKDRNGWEMEISISDLANALSAEFTDRYLAGRPTALVVHKSPTAGDQ